MNRPIDERVPGLARRMAAWLYEGILLFAVTFFATWIFSTLGQMRSGIDPRRELLIAFLFVVLGIYFAWFWSRGQTLAMKTWHIRVLQQDGQRLSQSRALWRYVLSWLWFLPPLALAELLSLHGLASMALVLVWVALWAVLSRWQPGQQFVHDRLAGTRLVDTRPASS